MNPPRSADRGAPVTVFGDFAIFDGTPAQAVYMVLGMAKVGAQVNPWPRRLFASGLPKDFLEILTGSRPDIEGPVVCATPAGKADAECIVGPDLFRRVAWEASRFPPSWLPELNRCRAVFASTVFVADVLRASGVEVPVEVVPDGVDPDVHHYEERPEREQLTTLIVGRGFDRKHHREAIAGWQQAFADDPEARLIIKTFWAKEGFPTLGDDSRIEFIDAIDPGRGLASLYRKADIFLSLGSEGTGIPMLEAMATGLPVIALASEGQGDVCSAAPDAVLPVQPSRWQTLVLPDEGPTGVQGIPDVDDVAAKLQWVASHRDEATDMGRRASDWVREHRNLWNYGPDVLAVVAEHGRRRRRPRSRSDRAGCSKATAAAANDGHR